MLQIYWGFEEPVYPTRVLVKHWFIALQPVWTRWKSIRVVSLLMAPISWSLVGIAIQFNNISPFILNSLLYCCHCQVMTLWCSHHEMDSVDKYNNSDNRYIQGCCLCLGKFYIVSKSSTMLDRRWSYFDEIYQRLWQWWRNVLVPLPVPKTGQNYTQVENKQVVIFSSWSVRRRVRVIKEWMR